MALQFMDMASLARVMVALDTVRPASACLSADERRRLIVYSFVFRRLHCGRRPFSTSRIREQNLQLRQSSCEQHANGAVSFSHLIGDFFRRATFNKSKS